MSISKFKYYGIIFYKKTHPKPKTLHKPQTTYCPTKKNSNDWTNQQGYFDWSKEIFPCQSKQQGSWKFA